MKLHYLIITFILLFSSANAQSNKKEVQYNVNKESHPAPWKNNRIGIYGSFMSGYGLAYQYIFSNRFAIKTQVFGFAILEDEDPANDRAMFVWGADIQYSILNTEDYRFYALTGMYYNYNENAKRIGYQNKVEDEYIRDLNFGIGLGAEVRLHDYICASFELGYYLKKSYNTKYNEDTIVDGIEEGYYDTFPLRLGLGVGAGIYIMF